MPEGEASETMSVEDLSWSGFCEASAPEGTPWLEEVDRWRHGGELMGCVEFADHVERLTKIAFALGHVISEHPDPGALLNEAFGEAGGESLWSHYLWYFAEEVRDGSLTVSVSDQEDGEQPLEGPAVDVFMECDACRANPGSPTLCIGCLHNRQVIDHLRKGAK